MFFDANLINVYSSIPVPLISSNGVEIHNGKFINIQSTDATFQVMIRTSQVLTITFMSSIFQNVSTGLIFQVIETLDGVKYYPILSMLSLAYK